jgi:hypothetical protein
MSTKPEEGAMSVEEDRRFLFESARQIIECGDVLNWFAGSWRKIVAGEVKNAKLLYLAATSRLFDKCMSVVVKGPSSVGKSNIRKAVLDFFPQHDVISFTTLSEKSLLYYQDDYSHKILSMGEAAGAEEGKLQTYLLRELISDGVLRYAVPMKVEGKGIVTEILVKHGPVVFMVTTTRAALEPEIETRMLSVEIDDSEEQTRRVLDKVAEMIGRHAAKASVDFSPWRDFQDWLALGPRKVDVPFARELGRLLVSAKAPRLRRDFSQILLAIQAHALLNQHHRQTDDCGQIVAEIDADYVPVAELMGGIMSEASGVGIEPSLQQTIDAVKVATADLPREEGATAFEVSTILNLDKSAGRRRLLVAIDKGYIVNLESRRGQPGRYRVTDQEVVPEPLLPSADALRGALATLATAPPHPKSQVFAQTKQNANGGTVAPVAEEDDPEPDLPEPSDDLEIPVFLKRGAA